MVKIATDRTTIDLFAEENGRDDHEQTRFLAKSS